VSRSLDHPDGPARGRRPGRPGAIAVAALTAWTVLVQTGLGVGSSQAAIGPSPVPVPKVAMPAAVEVFSPYLGQVSCDPTIKPGVQAFSDLVLATWGRGSNGGMTRSCKVGGESEHKEGRAWDWMLDPTNYTNVVAGARVLNWLLANDATAARRLGIMYIIWNNRIWSTYRRDEGWRAYDGADPHTSHIHFSFGWAGAMQRTSWWTGKVAPLEYGPCIPVVGQLAKPYGSAINLKPCPPPKKKGTAVPEPDPDTGKVTSSWFTPPPAP
jgi:hypothetical protein